MTLFINQDTRSSLFTLQFPPHKLHIYFKNPLWGNVPLGQFKTASVYGSAKNDGIKPGG